MKRILIVAFSILCLVGCGNAKEKIDIKEKIETHVHKYNKEVVTEPSCGVGGVVKFSCECGNYFVSALPARMHEPGEYVYDHNATFDEDGTETSTCALCGEKTTRKAVGTKLERIFKDIALTMRAKDEFTVVDASGLHELTITKGVDVEVDGESEDGMYRFHMYGRTFEALKNHFVTMAEYGYPEWYPRHPYSYFLFFDTYGNRQIESISREASDYRKIDSVSELRIIDGDIPPYQEFMTNFLTSEKVAYDCGGKTILLYDCSWYDNGYQMIVTYDFGDTVLANNIHSDASIGLFSTYEYFTWNMYDFNDNFLGTKNKYLSDYYLN